MKVHKFSCYKDRTWDTDPVNLVLTMCGLEVTKIVDGPIVRSRWEKSINCKSCLKQNPKLKRRIDK